ncbi:4-diphosphocytidyl-2-C-methyl-D-erythritol kinase [Alkalithermobacter thermoalcaliphilus JW-YL-7 = DSM 7308]|uniref:4-diphosphocytidyl-2-C-methyl-D-erythritol kinase n=1 Tax=Alkalithermobacter thermoalcaliphilus JW-YL-7 = DSM 7308 TaxID=1121328 RepID=A0A150FMU6_CLOPD|nr:4-diphosphocytidyl-2-C-methyl-D-erythritol kinase [[Clostridium] paradoxum JW-YL-7 = DSM 7308]SHL21766.1 4-diphosphocytidyl-2-C-methyl-D-erythritol kinase [[Clostridium] paradoxum JW-YL-7 = DSM 7308]
MVGVKLKSRAKINLSIDVVGKREDGYHFVEMIMQTIDLYDSIYIEEICEDKIIIHSKNKCVPLDENNIMHKAADMIKKKFNIEKGIKINLEKNIPIAAGMAGGSSNAAAVLVGLNTLWNLNMNEQDLLDLGLKLGADVPFCIKGGAALAEGIGEKLTPIDTVEGIFILICKPDISVSTKDVYKQLDMSIVNERPNTQKILNYIKEKDILGLSSNMKNVLESVTEKKYPVIRKIKDEMLKNGALGSMMTGSGPTVFGIYKDKEKANYAKDILKNNYKETYVVATYNGGIEIGR